MSDVRAIDFATDADLERLLRAREEMVGAAGRVRCRRCRKSIPGGKRADALYCSEGCKASFRWEQRNELVEEIRVARRAEKATDRCPCGRAIDTRLRPGPVPKKCDRCYHREYQRRRRQRVARREEQQ